MVTFRIDPGLKEAFRVAAGQEHRSIANRLLRPVRRCNPTLRNTQEQQRSAFMIKMAKQARRFPSFIQN